MLKYVEIINFISCIYLVYIKIKMQKIQKNKN